MTISKLKLILSQFAKIEMIKEGSVFTVFLTGKKLSNVNTYNKILGAIVDYTKINFPTIECMKTQDDFFLLVLKKSEKS